MSFANVFSTAKYFRIWKSVKRFIVLFQIFISKVRISIVGFAFVADSRTASIAKLGAELQLPTKGLTVIFKASVGNR